MADGRHRSPKKRIRNSSPDPVTLAEFYATVLESQDGGPPLVFLVPHDGAPASAAGSSGAQEGPGSMATEASRASRLEVVRSAASNRVSFNTDRSKRGTGAENLKSGCSVSTEHPSREGVHSAGVENILSMKASSTKYMADQNRSTAPLNVRHHVKENSEEKSAEIQNCVTVFRSRKEMHHPQNKKKDQEDNSSTCDRQQCAKYSDEGVSQYHSIFGDLKADKNYSYFDALWGSPSHRESNSRTKALETSTTQSTLRANRPERFSADCLNSSGNSCEKVQSSTESEDLNHTRQSGDCHTSQSSSNQSRSGELVSRHSTVGSLQHGSVKSSHEEPSEEARPLTTVIRFSKDKETYYVDNCCANMTRKFPSTSSTLDDPNASRTLASDSQALSPNSNVNFASDFGTSNRNLNLRDKLRVPQSKNPFNSLSSKLKNSNSPRGKQKTDGFVGDHLQNCEAVPENRSASLSPSNMKKSVNLLQPDKTSLPSLHVTRSNKCIQAKRSSTSEKDFPEKSKSTIAVSDDSTDTEDGEFDPSFKIERDPNSGLFLCRFCPFKAISELTIKQHSHLHNGDLVPIRRQKSEVLSKLSLYDQNDEALNSSVVTSGPTFTRVNNPEMLRATAQSVGMPNELIKHTTKALNKAQSSVVRTNVNHSKGNSSALKEETCSSSKNSSISQTNNEKSAEQRSFVNVTDCGARAASESQPGKATEPPDDRFNVTKRLKLGHGGYCCRFCNFTARKVQFMASHAKICKIRETALASSSISESAVSVQVHAKGTKTGIEKRSDVEVSNFQQSNFSRDDDCLKTLHSSNVHTEIPAGSSSKTVTFEDCASNSATKPEEENVAALQVLPRVPYRKLAKPFGCPLCPFSATKMKAIRRHQAKCKH